jgi:hypothetical protein
MNTPSCLADPVQLTPTDRDEEIVQAIVEISKGCAINSHMTRTSESLSSVEFFRREWLSRSSAFNHSREMCI